jgi:large subunit ribosomal protein L29
MGKTREARELVHEMSDEALVQHLSETRHELFNQRFKHVTGQLDNYRSLRELKRDIARANTEIRAREIRAAEAGEKS